MTNPIGLHSHGQPLPELERTGIIAADTSLLDKGRSSKLNSLIENISYRFAQNRRRMKPFAMRVTIGETSMKKALVSGCAFDGADEFKWPRRPCSEVDHADCRSLRCANFDWTVEPARFDEIHQRGIDAPHAAPCSAAALILQSESGALLPHARRASVMTTYVLEGKLPAFFHMESVLGLAPVSSATPWRPPRASQTSENVSSISEDIRPCLIQIP